MDSASSAFKLLARVEVAPTNTVRVADPTGPRPVVRAGGMVGSEEYHFERVENLAEGSGYQVRRLLAEGGSGLVWEAWQASLERDVVVKTLKPQGDPRNTLPAETSIGTDADLLRMFRQEALTVASLQHPNIVPVIDLRTDEKGRQLLAMLRVRGVSWASLLHPSTTGSPEVHERAHGMTLRDHLEILLKVCDAVAYAHHHGIIHRDLKPSQVMVGEFGEVVLLDWGLAMSIDDAPATPPVPTEDGCPPPTRPRAPRRPEVSPIAGSPAYMAPEQTYGDGDALDRRTDVYLLGGMLYEILTRKPPHPGDSCAAAFGHAMSGEFIAPAERAPTRSIPESLAGICRRAMAHDPRQRPEDALRFKREVEAYLKYRTSGYIYSEAFWEVCAGEQMALSRPVLVKRVARSMEAGLQAPEEHPIWGGRRREIIQRMLMTEARVYSRLWHSSIPTLYDLDQDDEGFPILILRPWPRQRWVDKVQLHPIADQHAVEFTGPRQLWHLNAPNQLNSPSASEPDADEVWPLAKNLRVLWQVASIIEYVHHYGIIYRGLRPSTIRVGAHGQVVLVNWSTALQIRTMYGIEPIPAPPPNSINMDPLFAAPECLSGDHDHVSYAADIYGLGALLYFVLTGCSPHWPWELKSPVLSLEACRQMALDGQIRDPREVAGEGRPVPEAAVNLAMSALQRDPARRMRLRHFILGLERISVLME